VQTILKAGRINGLTQTLLKYTAPGVPDIYQGGELWDLSLVDPDNRRPVDYKLREHLLKELALKGTGFSPYVEGPIKSGALAPEGANACSQHNFTAALADPNDPGLPKLWLVHQALTLRNEHPAYFGAEAAYTPLTASGLQSDCVIAYLRGDRVLTVAPRWSFADAKWDNTTIALPSGNWVNRLTGERMEGGEICLTKLLIKFPVALLMREEELVHA